MNKTLTKLTYDEIDKLLTNTDKDLFNNINWTLVTEDEMESLLRTP